MSSPGRSIVLIGLGCRASLRVEIGLHPLGGQSHNRSRRPRGTGSGSASDAARAGGAPHAPTLPALRPSDDLLGIELKRLSSAVSGSTRAASASLSRPRASRAPAERTPAGPHGCATARAAHRRAPRRRARPQPHRSLSPRRGSPGRSAQSHGSRSRLAFPANLRPVDRDHPRLHQPRLVTQAQAPTRTAHPTPPRDDTRTGRSSRDQAPRVHRDHPARDILDGMPARSPARTAPSSNTRTTTSATIIAGSYAARARAHPARYAP